MNIFPSSRDGAGLSWTRQEKSLLPALRGRSGLLRVSPEASEFARLCPPIQPFLIATRQLLEMELSCSQQRRNDFLIATFSALFANLGLAEPRAESRGNEIRKNRCDSWLALLHRFSEFQSLKVFCMLGSVKSAKHASRSMGPSTMQAMSERFTTSVAGI
jgi:hypothetical protein